MSSELNIELPRTVDVGAIDRELRNLWREASSDTAHPVARARILNLVVFVDAPELEAVADMAAELAVHHPARTILAALDLDSKEERLEAEVSARCHLSFGQRKQICSEQVVIRAAGNRIDDVHGVVLPLLTSDLPTFMWWRSSKWPSGRSFRSISASCDRVILDSSRLADSPSGVSSLDAFMRDKSRGPGARFSVADLNWSRLTPWRIALAELYDLASYRTYLNRAGRFTLTYSAGNNQTGKSGSPPASALLAAGWLSSRLGWGWAGKVAKNGGEHSIGFDKGGRHIELILSPASTPVAPAESGTVDGLKIETESEPSATFSIQLADGCLETRIELNGRAQVPRIVGCGAASDPDLVGEELDIIGRDAAYEDAVTAGANIANALG